MKKNAGGTWRRTRGLGIVRLPRVALLVMALAVPAGILLAIPGPASAQGANSDLMALVGPNPVAVLPVTATSAQAIPTVGHAVKAEASANSETAASRVTGEFGLVGTLANPAPVAPGGSISGTVTAAGRGPAKGRRLRGICVGAITPQGAVAALTATAPNGTYTLTGLAAGNYLVNFQSSEFCNGGNSASYVAQWYHNQPTQATASTVTVRSRRDTGSINAALQPGGSISGTVTAAGGGPLDGICVGTVTPQGATVIISTAPDGTYTLDGLPAGNYLVEFITAPGCGSNSGSYVAQWYNNQPTQATANTVAVTVGVDTGSINAALVRVPVTMDPSAPLWRPVS